MKTDTPKISMNKEQHLFFFDTFGFSMWPFLKGGQKLLIKKLPAQDLRMGDIILYRQDEKMVCHRLIKKIKDGDRYILYVRGDNSLSWPEAIAEDQFLGKAVGILRNEEIVSLTGLRQSFVNRLISVFAPLVSILAKVIKPYYVKIFKDGK